MKYTVDLSAERVLQTRECRLYQERILAAYALLTFGTLDP